MISLFKCIALVVSFLIYTCDALNCNLKDELVASGGQDCSVSIEGQSFENKCQVTIVNTDVDGKNAGHRGCVETGSDSCGASIVKDEIKTKVCCCVGDNCNNDTFEAKCASGEIIESSGSDAFKCHMKLDMDGGTIIKAEQDCSGPAFINKCQTTSLNTNGKYTVFRGCVLADNKALCGRSYSVAGVTTKKCCCDVAKCNDDMFETQCVNYGTIGLPRVISIGKGNGAASITGSIMLMALVFAMFVSI